MKNDDRYFNHFGHGYVLFFMILMMHLTSKMSGFKQYRQTRVYIFIGSYMYHLFFFVDFTTYWFLSFSRPYLQ